MDPESIPGVGPKTAAALADIDDPERALREGDVAAIAAAPEITPARAARIARSAIQARHDESGDVLATDRATEIHRSILDLLQSRAVTDAGRQHLRTLYPSTARSRIDSVRERVERAIDREYPDDLSSDLAAVHPRAEAATVRVRERCLATGDAERYAAATERFPEISVETVADARELADLAEGYATVIALDRAFGGLDIEGDVRVRPDALDDPVAVVPERVLATFGANRDALRAAIAVHRRVGLDPPCDLDALDAALDQIDADGSVRPGAEIERLERAIEGFDDAVGAAEQTATDHLRAAIEDRDVTIEGADLLSLAERGAGVDTVLERELGDAFDAAVSAGRSAIVDRLDLESRADRVDRALPDEPTYPIAFEESVLADLRAELRAARDRRRLERTREVARELAPFREAIDPLLDAALAVDVDRAIARFAAEYDCTMPEIEGAGTEGSGIDIVGGRNPLLPEAPGGVDPVDYTVAGVRLLSGVNSGGKTSTLDLIATVTILAQMGLPVPADRVRTPIVPSINYYGKHRGTLDAGAFESTLREFETLIDDAGQGALVLVDELESITEPGASARIVAGICEALADRETTAVFVSHLAREIREETTIEIQVDGIQAVGLDDGDLVVERSPVEGVLARSTPELIVEKLADETDRAFYDRLLGKFEAASGD
ncbi:MutS-related protein [Halococcoides cellulosivorans]|uniref:DNA-binding protein MutS2 n=1 Tax=Halococcoides cellulosivorans TaxID=1679096 RepID=A0A2R4X2I3_9EURY|nr:helix-hairpin-helix domain-containing protein [Halococcoides cellulosivorans]AWB28007.1 DNA mismatch repair protein MutS [Halococcoides cellulosivorans]